VSVSQECPWRQSSGRWLRWRWRWLPVLDARDGGSSIRSCGDGSQIGDTVAAPSRSRGRATAGPGTGKQRQSRGPEASERRWHSQGGRARGAPRRVSSDGAARGSRFEHRHGRREVRVATVARDILRSSTVRATRVMTSIRSYVLDGVLRRLPPPIRVMSIDYYVLYLPHALFTLKTVGFMLEHGVRILVSACIFFPYTLKRQFLNLYCM
jgi:hypothetical protein